MESWNSSYWSLLVALDVFVLAICVFWNIREAFLPPVTIEDLDALLESSTKPPPSDSRRKVPGTRGWYENAFERVNFIVPLLLTLMFVAIQVVVLRVKR